VEELTGDNQYNTEEYGKQDAIMGCEFLQFPIILHLHLRRFEYDPLLNGMAKVNSRFEFPSEVNLSKYLSVDADHTVCTDYALVGVLVHAGGSFGGHYYAFLRPTGDDAWFEFNDSSVTRASAEDAIDANFGGEGHFSAYMLVYVRQDELSRIFQPVPDSLIPAHVRSFLNQQQQAAEARENMQTYYILTDHYFQVAAEHRNFNFPPSGRDLANLKKIELRRQDVCHLLYTEVHSMLPSLPSDFTIYSISAGTSTRIPDSSTRQISWHPKPLIYVRNAPDEDDDCLLFVYLFFPRVDTPCRYAGSFLYTEDETLGEFGTTICRTLRVDSRPSRVWRLSNCELRRLDLSDFGDGLSPGESIVYKVKPGTPCALFEDIREIPGEPIAYLATTEYEISAKTYFTDVSQEMESLAKFNTTYIKVVFPVGISTDSLREWLVATVFGLRHPERFGLYADTDVYPVTQSGLACPDAYFEIVRFDSPGDIAQSLRAIVLVSNGYLPGEEKQILVAKQATLADISVDEFAGMETRVLQCSRDGLVKKWPKRKTRVASGNCFRIEVVPEAQRGIGKRNFVPVSYRTEERVVSFLLLLVENEIFADTRVRIEEELARFDEGQEWEFWFKKKTAVFARPVELMGTECVADMFREANQGRIRAKPKRGAEKRYVLGDVCSSVRIHN
jgi:hypothetical protein